jgi:hypothetical protein
MGSGRARSPAEIVAMLRDAGFALMVALFPVAVVPLCIVAEWLANMSHRR